MGDVDRFAGSPFSLDRNADDATDPPLEARV
jgi:hypothetical protein